MFLESVKGEQSRTKVLSKVTCNKCFHAEFVALNDLAVIESSQEIPEMNEIICFD